MISLEEQLSPQHKRPDVATLLDGAAGETLVSAEDQNRGGHPQREKSGVRKTIVWLQILAFVLGVGLLVAVIRRVGVQPIFDALGRIGFGFFYILLISGLRHLFRSLAMSAAVPPEHRRFSWHQALSARLGGEAISFLTFTGPVLGEATKVALLRKRVPLTSSVSALVIDNLLYNLSVALFIMSGACVMLIAYPLPSVVWYVLVAIAASASLCLLAVGYAASKRMMPLTSLVSGLSRLRLNRRTLAGRRKQIRLLESNVYNFYRERPTSFAAMLGYNLFAHATSVLEVYLTLRLLGFHPQIHSAYVIESLTKVINFAFGFVPATIGVYEGGTELILRTLGFVKAAGVTLAIVRKAGSIFWTGIGLVILVHRTVPEVFSRLVDRHPRIQKLMDNLVLSNLMHRPARTLTSILGVGIGVLLIVFTVGLAHGVLHEKGRREGNIGAEIMVRAAGTLSLSGSQPFTLPVSRVEEMERIEGVRNATPLAQNLIGSDSGFGSRMIEGIEFEDYAALSGIKIINGRGLQEGDEAIVDEVWQEQRKAPLGSTIQLYDRPFRIVGVYGPPGGGRIKIPLRTMQEQLGGEGHCSSVLVACQNPAQQEQVAARIRAVLPEDQIIFTRELPELYASGLPALNIFINVVVSIAAVISMLVILLAMYTSVMERTRQIGVLKSLGMSNTLIAWVVQQEAIVVSVLGVLCGIILTLLVRFAVMRATTLTIEIEPKWLVISLGIGLLGGTIGALYPALRAARQDAVKALNYE